LLEEVKDAILNVQSAKSLSQAAHLKKLRDYRTLYRIRVADNYRIGVVVRKNVVWFVRFGHRSSFYGKFP
jgi:mRNA interferase RelE/StbE